MFNSWPFSTSEWDEVENYACSLFRSSATNMPIDHDIALQQLWDYLDDLELRYGRHPALLETRADFLSDPYERCILYREAIELSSKYDLPTYSLRTSLAEVLGRDCGQLTLALAELKKCERETKNIGDATDVSAWAELFDEFSRMPRSIISE